MIMRKFTAPRGIRNNNPGNIRATRDKWDGMVGEDKEGFVIFSAMAYGIRAMSRNLDSYERRGLNTIETIISVWAPPNENNTESYITSVERQTGINRNQPLSKSDRPKLIAAIISHENGLSLGKALIQLGIELA
jgi:hypothetical protein